MRRTVLVMTAVVVLAACGGGDGSTSSPRETQPSGVGGGSDEGAACATAPGFMVDEIRAGLNSDVTLENAMVVLAPANAEGYTHLVAAKNADRVPSWALVVDGEDVELVHTVNASAEVISTWEPSPQERIASWDAATSVRNCTS